MSFEEREVQYPGLKKLTKVNAENQPIEGEGEIYVNIERAEGTEYNAGTPINAENLNKSNWRDDDSLSFKAMKPGEDLPNNKCGETQIIANDDGEVWILPPKGKASNFKLGGDSGMPIGTIFSAIRADLPTMSYGLPVGCVRLDGYECNRANFPDFYDMAVAGKFGSTKSFEEYKEDLTANGNCGYIGLDTTPGNERFKVPTLTNGMVIANGTNMGEYSKGGLPNIKGELKLTAHDTDYYASSMSGAIDATSTISCYNSDNTTNTGNHWGGFSFNASASSPIYSNDVTTVIPNHIKYPYFMVIANVVPESSQAVWDDFVGNLGNKANIDLTNIAWNQSRTSTNGYLRLPNGLLFQWGRFTPAGGYVTINFPIAFTGSDTFAFSIGNVRASNDNAEAVTWKARTTSATDGASVEGRVTYGAAGIWGNDTNMKMSWMAIGY